MVALEVRRFDSRDIPAIERLNSRFAAAGVPHRVGQEDRRDEPSLDRQPIIERLYVAAANGEIRGGVWLKEQLFWSAGRPLRVGWAKYLVAESLIDAKAAGVPGGLLFTLLRQQPLLMGLGMGGHAGPYARLLAAAGWTSSSVPFFIYIAHPSRVLRSLPQARATPLRRVLASGLAHSGLAWAGTRLLTLTRALRWKRPRGYAYAPASRFEAWADEIWERCRDAYGFLAIRDSRALNALYPDGFRALTRLRVRRGGADVGWVCARAFEAAGTWFEQHVGNVRLGILTDSLAHPRDAHGVLDAGFRYLVDHNVDVMLMYLSHPAWAAAAINLGFLRAPSRSAFYRSPAVESVIAESAALGRNYHLTWSDGDGPELV